MQIWNARHINLLPGASSKCYTFFTTAINLHLLTTTKNHDDHVAQLKIRQTTTTFAEFIQDGSLLIC